MSSKNYAVAPGAYLEEWITDNDMSQGTVAERMGSSRKLVNEIINGRAPITEDTAMRLERVVGIPADSWLRFEAAYRADLVRITDQENLAAHIDDINPHAAAYLRSVGATSATRKTPGKLVSDFLSFHRCGTWESYLHLNRAASTGDYALAALKDPGAAMDPTLLSTWLRAGELTEQFERGKSYTYNENGLRNALPQLKKRAANPDNLMLPDIRSILADVGVVFMVAAPPKNFPLLGMTRWIEKRVPVIQQTGRWGKDGFVIWALFHELGHVLNDPRGEMHLEFSSEKKRNSAAEAGANKFAMDVLFGEDGMSQFSGLKTVGAIAAKSREIGIAPGVAVHQMHRRRMLDYAVGNGLCVTLSNSLD